jgi:hypothetical protein
VRFCLKLKETAAETVAVKSVYLDHVFEWHEGFKEELRNVDYFAH